MNTTRTTVNNSLSLNTDQMPCTKTMDEYIKTKQNQTLLIKAFTKYVNVEIFNGAKSPHESVQ